MSHLVANATFTSNIPQKLRLYLSAKHRGLFKAFFLKTENKPSYVEDDARIAVLCWQLRKSTVQKAFSSSRVQFKQCDAHEKLQ